MIGLVKQIISASVEQKTYQDIANTTQVKKMPYFLNRCSHRKRPGSVAYTEKGLPKSKLSRKLSGLRKTNLRTPTLPYSSVSYSQHLIPADLARPEESIPGNRQGLYIIWIEGALMGILT